MAQSHLVRVGAMGNVGRFYSPDGAVYPRAARVIVRSGRGLEMGHVLLAEGDLPRDLSDGAVLRRMTVEDELLEARQAKNRDAAYAACAERIARARLPVVLMDVEHLFDGQTLVFYFLGEPSEELEAITSELTELYEAKVQFRKFTETLTEGCGPACGTEAAAGHGCGSCATGCALAGACGTRKH
jgi:cell fate regulator YaaT (PSP1 superfamily)